MPDGRLAVIVCGVPHEALAEVALVGLSVWPAFVWPEPVVTALLPTLLLGASARSSCAMLMSAAVFLASALA